jgi:hypothetical protein
MYLFGGHDGAQTLADVHALEVERFSWSLLGMLGAAPEGREGASVGTTHGELLVVAGGRSAAADGGWKVQTDVWAAHLVKCAPAAAASTADPFKVWVQPCRARLQRLLCPSSAPAEHAQAGLTIVCVQDAVGACGRRQLQQHVAAPWWRVLTRSRRQGASSQARPRRAPRAAAGARTLPLLCCSVPCVDDSAGPRPLTACAMHARAALHLCTW